MRQVYRGDSSRICYRICNMREFPPQTHTEKSRTKRNRRAEILPSTAADRVEDTNRKYNNQPNIHFIACLGRVYLRCWRDWSAVALSVSHLVSGPFSSTRTQVDCFESLHIVQHCADGAETFAYEAHGCRPASCTLVSCIGAVQRWFQGSIMLRVRCGKNDILSGVEDWENSNLSLFR